MMAFFLFLHLKLAVKVRNCANGPLIAQIFDSLLRLLSLAVDLSKHPVGCYFFEPSIWLDHPNFVEENQIFQAISINHYKSVFLSISIRIIRIRITLKGKINQLRKHIQKVRFSLLD